MYELGHNTSLLWIKTWSYKAKMTKLQNSLRIFENAKCFNLTSTKNEKPLLHHVIPPHQPLPLQLTNMETVWTWSCHNTSLLWIKKWSYKAKMTKLQNSLRIFENGKCFNLSSTKNEKPLLHHVIPPHQPLPLQLTKVEIVWTWS